MKYQFLLSLALPALVSAFPQNRANQGNTDSGSPKSQTNQDNVASGPPLNQASQGNGAICIPANLSRGLSVTDDQSFATDCIEANAQLGSGSTTIDPGSNIVIAQSGTCEIVVQNTIGTQSLTLQNFDLQGDAQVLLDPDCPDKLAFTIATSGGASFVLTTFPAGSSNPQNQLPSDLSNVN